MKTTERLAVGDRCTAAESGLRAMPKPGVIKDVLPKGYRVLVDGEKEARHFSVRKVKPAQRKPGPQKRKPFNRTEFIEKLHEKFPRQTEVDISVEPPRCPPNAGDMITIDAAKAIEKPTKPWRSESYKAMVRAQPCANCGKPGPSDPDHIGKRGVAQKCSDALCIPLCRDCHILRTGTPGNPCCLPSPADSQRRGKTVLCSKEETTDVARKAQAELLGRALALLPLEVRADALRKAVESVPEEVLNEALR